MIFSTEYCLAFNTLIIYYGENKNRTERERERERDSHSIKSKKSNIANKR